MKRVQALLLVVVCGCGPAAGPPPAPPTPGGSASPSSSPLATEAAAVPLFEGLGSHGRRITTSSVEAQRYFDQGLAFAYAFNHDEAVRSFTRAGELDPAAAMPHWGVALSLGPHINNPTVDEARAKAAWAALGRARERAAGASEVERALVEALGARYADPQPADRKPLDLAYADAMRATHRRFPDDADVAALLAEALMDLRPWDQWTPEGRPTEGTEEVLATLEALLARAPEHPLANHLYIHAVEASPSPDKADASAERLRAYAPALGHLVHMPSHIDVRRGRWAEAIAANERAIEADRAYRERVPRQGFYRIYMAHNHHMLAFASMMTGQSQRAIASVCELVGGVPEDWLKENAAFADGFLASPYEVLMRFGRWDEILAEPEPADYLPLARALRRYARAVALAAKGDREAAEAERKAFLVARAAVPHEAFFGNNAAHDLLDVAEHLVAGELLVLGGKAEAGLGELREAVRREDGLRYDEPPDWIQPVRHALGAALLRSGRLAEAEAVYREDLRRLPENGWSLFGLARGLRLQGRAREAEEVEARFANVWEKGDVKLASSCFCQPGV